MFGLIFIAIILIFAFNRRRHCRALLWERWEKHDSVDEFDDPHRGFHGWRDRIHGHARQWASETEHRVGEKMTRRAERFERRMRRRFDQQTNRWSGESADPEPERRPGAARGEKELAYQRARRRAAAKAGFYVHLMWYGLVIGFLFLINLLTTSSQWWLFPAIGWGFGLLSHFAAVFGWRWIHEQVFEPAIQREVEREVTREKEVLRTEKQASLDELTATFAHEIRNPIAAARSLVQQMGEDPTSAENVEYAKVALDELGRVERSVSHLLKYAKQEDYYFQKTNLASVLDGALGQMRSKIEGDGVLISRNYLSGPLVRADAEKLQSVFTNIIDNAIDAMAGMSGERRVEVKIERDSAAMAIVKIRDNGCGIAPEQRTRIFNPFFTSKENGTGLGLGVARKIIDAHRGTIQVDSEPGAGAEFTIAIPLAPNGRDAERNEPSDVAHERSEGPQGAVATNDGLRGQP